MAADAASLDERARRRALNALLVYTFFMVAGFTMVMPLVAVHFVDRIGLTAAAIGAALAIRQITQQGLAVFGGALADRIGNRPMIVAGVLLRALGFTALGFATDMPTLFVAMLVSALGGALFEAPYQAAIASLTTDDDRARYYSISNTISGIATTGGPLLGVALLRFDFRIVCFAAAACFGLNAAVALLLPRLPVPAEAPRLAQGFRLVLRNRPFVLLTLIMMGYWFVSVQINITFPLLVVRLTGSEDGIGVMFALSAAMTILLQYPATRWLELRLATEQILTVGVVLMAVGMLVIAFVGSFPTFLAAVAVFSLGTLLTRPTQQAITAGLADRNALGTFLGFNSLALAIGGGMGNFLGGWMFDTAGRMATPMLPWLVFAIVALFTSLALRALLGRRMLAASVSSTSGG
ncbi:MULTISPECIES: MFS transporter [unclassified Sphingomonas]|jgi:DHA1 family multidrug resistance protein-like MFS transporter|uniref:MFS transporter n=1 Tax=unclassified Sphingomonas TaxID=196159 RepID=UPI0025E92E15|nr:MULTISPECIES: MFS transporter [unclassified Sphingomonas]